jgi:hypothetical protein
MSMVTCSAADTEPSWELLAAAACEQEESMRPGEDRIVRPVPRWGADSSLIEDWFNAGEELQHSKLELPIEEPDRWERALQWMRSLAVATGLRPA